jgi:hypothetical protein
MRRIQRISVLSFLVFALFSCDFSARINGSNHFPDDFTSLQTFFDTFSTDPSSMTCWVEWRQKDKNDSYFSTPFLDDGTLLPLLKDVGLVESEASDAIGLDFSLCPFWTFYFGRKTPTQTDKYYFLEITSDFSKNYIRRGNSHYGDFTQYNFDWTKGKTLLNTFIEAYNKHCDEEKKTLWRYEE